MLIMATGLGIIYSVKEPSNFHLIINILLIHVMSFYNDFSDGSADRAG